MRVWCWTKRDVGEEERVSTKVSAISTKISEKYGQNGMGEKGEMSWMEEEEN
jgi:hypothetical protein